jgi:hypothetical protein
MKQFCSLVIVFASLQSFIQAQDLYMPRNIKTAYQKDTRSLTGAPGANYWQNKGYMILPLRYTQIQGLLQEQKKLFIQTTVLIL